MDHACSHSRVRAGRQDLLISEEGVNLDTFMKVQEGLCFDGEYINLFVTFYRLPFISVTMLFTVGMWIVVNGPA